MRPASAFDLVKQKLNVAAVPISRAILGAQVLMDFAEIKALTDEFRLQFADLTGLLINTHGFAVFAVEGFHATVVAYLEALQAVSRPSDNVTGALKIAYEQQLKKKQPKLSQPRVFLFAEDCKQTLTSFFSCSLNLANAREEDLKPAEALSFMVVSLTKIMCLANLASKNGDDFVEKALFSIPPSELFAPSYLEKFCGGDADMRSTEPQVATVKLEVRHVEEEVEQQIEAVKRKIGGGDEECDAVYSLDEFLLQLVYSDQMELMEDEAANLNEFWLYENLKHILSE